MGKPQQMTMKPQDARAKLNLARRWEFKCAVCGHEFETLASITVEHLVPRSKGGKGGDNKAPSHHSCNSERGTMSLIKAAIVIGKKLNSLGAQKHQWLNKAVPNRIVPAVAHLHPVDAGWFFL